MKLWLRLAVAVACWVSAVLVALNDIDFFTLNDLFDTTEPHHEHIVVFLIVLGFVAMFLHGRRYRC